MLNYKASNNIKPFEVVEIKLNGLKKNNKPSKEITVLFKPGNLLIQITKNIQVR